MSDLDIQKEILKKKYGDATYNERGDLEWYRQYLMLDVSDMKDEIDAYRKNAEEKVKEAKKELDKASIPTIEDMDIIAQAGKDLLPLLQATDSQINDLLERYDLYDKDSSNKLSALQQGIQGITEDTGGALEAYMNGVSQQVYLQSDLLTQIRDSIVGFDLDVQVATMSQMLIQLQNSYQVQLAIQSRLDGWSNANDMAIRVEMVKS